MTIPAEASPFSLIKQLCFINAPWYDLKEKYLDLFLLEKIQPEIGLEGLCLYDEQRKDFERVAKLLAQNGLNCTLHAPFFDLAPGGLDPHILAKTRDKLALAFDLIPVFKPRSIVCHLQFEANKHGYVFEQWLKAALDTWTPLINAARRYNVVVNFENTYEHTPGTHTTFLSSLKQPGAGFCLDTGHLMTFAHSTWEQWLPAMLPWLGQLHLHDNNGARDEHLAPGKGLFDFPGLFAFLRKNGSRPILTLEPHSEDDMRQSFLYFETTGLLRAF